MQEPGRRNRAVKDRSWHQPGFTRNQTALFLAFPLDSSLKAPDFICKQLECPEYGDKLDAKRLEKF